MSSDQFIVFYDWEPLMGVKLNSKSKKTQPWRNGTASIQINTQCEMLRIDAIQMLKIKASIAS